MLLPLQVSTLALCAQYCHGRFINPSHPDGGQTTNPAPSATPVPDFSQNPVWPLGSTQQIQWTANVDTYNLRLYQRFVSEQFPDINGYTYSAIGNGTGHQSFTWQVELGPGYLPNTGFSDQASEVFFFEVVPIQSSAGVFDSRYINITGSASTAATSPIVPNVVSATATDIYPHVVPATATDDHPSASTHTARVIQSEDRSKSDDSSVRKVALGVGIGVGVPVVVLLCVLLVCCWRLLRQSRKAQDTPTTPQPKPEPEPESVSVPKPEPEPEPQAAHDRLKGSDIREYFAPRTDNVNQ